MTAKWLLTLIGTIAITFATVQGADISFQRVDDDDQSALFGTLNLGFTDDHAHADDSTSGATSSGPQGSTQTDDSLAENADAAAAISGNTHADVEVTLVAWNTTAPESSTYVPNVLIGIGAIDDIVATDDGDWGSLSYRTQTFSTGVFEAQNGPGDMSIDLGVTVDAFETPYMAYFYVCNQIPNNRKTGSWIEGQWWGSMWSITGHLEDGTMWGTDIEEYVYTYPIDIHEVATRSFSNGHACEIKAEYWYRHEYGTAYVADGIFEDIPAIEAFSTFFAESD